MRVLTTHLGLRRAERRKQLRALAAIVDSRLEIPTVLAGDFNVWWGKNAALSDLVRDFVPATGPRTFPSRRPLLRLDRIWAQREHWAVERVRAHATAAARSVSDHLPLCATLRLRNGAAGIRRDAVPTGS